MKELTTDLPKPMIPVGGVPVLERILKGLRETGVREFLIVTGYKSEVVHQHFGDGSRWDAQVSYVQQVVQDGTGRVVDLARKFAGNDDFLLSYGDILVNATTYSAMQKCWTTQPSDALMAVKLGEDLRQGGTAIFDENFLLRELVEKPTDEQIRDLQSRFGELKPWYNAGIYIFSPRIFEFTARLKKSARGEYELTDAMRDLVQSGGTLRGLPLTDLWIDVRDPQVLAQANKSFETL